MRICQFISQTEVCSSCGSSLGWVMMIEFQQVVRRQSAACCVLLAAALWAVELDFALADDAPATPVPPTAEKLGLDVGNKVPTFYVRAVTGPLKNKSVCYVCRNGERPVVLVIVREITPELPALLRRIDELVDGHRAEGLRSFAVFVANNGKEWLPDIQTFAFDNKINLPLTISAALAESPVAPHATSDAAVTVVVYRDQIVLHRAAFRPGELKAGNVETITRMIRDLSAGTDVRP